MTGSTEGITLEKLMLCRELMERQRMRGNLYQYEMRTLRKAKGRVVEPEQIQNNETQTNNTRELA